MFAHGNQSDRNSCRAVGRRETPRQWFAAHFSAARFGLVIFLANLATGGLNAQEVASPPSLYQPRQRIVDLSDSAAPQLRLALQPEQIAPGPRPPAPVGDQPPAAPGAAPAQPLPPIKPDVFAPEQVRLPLLDSGTGGKSVGSTPTPSPQVQEQFRQYIDRTIDPQNTLDLIQGRPRLLILKQAPVRVQVADENVASYTLIAETEVSVVGNSIGSTVLNLWFADPQKGAPPHVLSYLVRVLPDPEEKQRLERVYQALETEINKAFSDSVVHLALVGDKLVLSGQAHDIVDATQIVRVVAANAPGGNRTRNGYQPDEIPVSQVNVVATPAQLAQAGQNPQAGLENFILRNTNRNIINLLRVPGEQQVMLRVSVAEVDRTAARSIGMDFSIGNNKGQAVFSQVSNGLVMPPGSTSPGIGPPAFTFSSSANLPTLLDNGQVALAIRALRNLSLARSMAEPNLVTLNGQPAQFRAGGEFPVPAATQAFGGVGQGVAFVPFGVSLNFLPQITDRDRVRLQLSAVVSTLDPTLGANVGGSSISGGTSVPGLQTRTFQNVVELRSGQTLAVAGLIQNTFSAMTNRVPFFGDIPIIGNLFGRNDTTSGDQELVILVTPELVGPLEACHTPHLPGDDVYEPGDVEFYIYGRLESRRTEDYRTSVRTDWDRMHNYERCEDKFIIGAKGHSFNCCGPDCHCPKD